MIGDAPAKLVLVQMAAESRPSVLGGGPWWYDGSPFRMARLTAQCSLTGRQMGWALRILDESSLARPEALPDGLVFRLGLYADRQWVAPDVKNHAPVPTALRREVFARDGLRCVLCGSTDRLHADHIYPRWLGGLNLLENLRTLCRSCNLAKGMNADGP